MSRRSARSAAAQPKYTETSDNESPLSDIDTPTLDAIAGQTDTTPKKRNAGATATTKVKTEKNENVNVKASPRKAKANGATEQDVEVKPTKERGVAAKKKTEVDDEAEIKDELAAEETKTTTTRVKVRVGKKSAVEIEPQEVEVVEKSHAAAKRKAKTDDGEEETAEGLEVKEKKVVKRRKTKEEKEAELLPLRERTDMSTLERKMYIGAHVSSAGGVQNSITNAVHVGANAYALFLKSQRKWASPDMAQEAKEGFLKNCEEQKFDAAAHILPHGSYLVNMAQKEKDKADQAYDCFLDDLNRCEALGIKLYNFHPGSTGGQPRNEAIGRIAAQLNKAHKATSTVVTVLENMAGAGNVIGSTFEDLRDIIALIDDKSRVGVCMDTCHSFAAGYDLRTAESFGKVMEEFNTIVGANYLRALHLNDSKTPLSSNRDLHANIGTGFLGLRAFCNVVNYPGFENLPMVLETPIDRKGSDGKSVEDKSVWADEIKLLESLIGANYEDEKWREVEERLQDEGKEERAKFEKQVEKKKQKSIADMFKKASGKGKKGTKEEEVEAEEPVGEEDEEGGCKH